MTAAGPWSVKGIDPKAREMAKDLARRSGMTLGEWLNQMIIDGMDADAPPPPFESELAAYGRAPPLYTDRPSHRIPERRRILDDMYREATLAQDAETQLRQEGRGRRPQGRAYREMGLGAMAHRSGFEAEAASDEVELARITKALEALSNRLETAEHRSTLAISGIDQSVMGVLSRLDSLNDTQAETSLRLETSIEQVRDTQARVAERVRRMEAEDGSRVDALRALEGALGRLAGQINEGTTRAEAAANQAREDIEALGRRVNRAEAASEAAASHSDLEAISRRVGQVEQSVAQAPEAYADAEKVETVLARISERLERAEARTTAAVESLESSFAGLDARLRKTESRTAEADSGLERRFQTLANEFAQKVDASRADFAEQIRKAASGDKINQLEASLRDLTQQAAQAEKRSAQAIDRIGREVVSIAQSLGERVAAAEARSSAAVSQITGELARIGETVDTRLTRADANQAQALEKLGGEIARIAARLNDRIAASEQRAAKAVDDATARFARLTDGLSERQDRTANELTDRIKQSEARAAKLLDDARETLEARVEQTAAPPAPAPVVREAPAPRAAAQHAPAPSSASATAFEDSDDPFADLRPSSFVTKASTANAFQDDPFASRRTGFSEPSPSPAPIQAARASADAFESSPFDPDDDFLVPSTQSRADIFSTSLNDFAVADTFVTKDPLGKATTGGADFGDVSQSDFASAPPPGERPISTRDMIEQARAATRRAAAGGKDQARPPGVPAPPLDSKLDDKPFGSPFGQKRKKDTGGSTLRTMALASGWACALTAAGYGAYALAVHDSAAPPKPQIADLAETPTAAPPMTPNGEPKVQQAAVALTSAPGATPIGSVAPGPAAGPISAAATVSSAAATTAKTLSAQPGGQAAPAQPAGANAKANPVENARSLYDKAVRQVEAGDKAGLADLKRAANLGYAPAQFYLARLYDAGNGGVSKDIVEARRLTALAAQGGDPSAMYNYASYLYNGDGGAKDSTSAVVWFRKAAEQGIVNSQYNLAQLYETGHGVAQNLSEAYKWYLVAAYAGDTQAKENADALRRTLPANARASAEAAAASLHARAAGGAHVASAAKSMRPQ